MKCLGKRTSEFRTPTKLPSPITEVMDKPAETERLACKARQNGYSDEIVCVLASGWYMVKDVWDDF